MNPDDVKRLQQNLGVTDDGVQGAHTLAAVLQRIGHAKDPAQYLLLGTAMASDFPKYDISTPLRQVHFLARASEETGGFRYTTELWGPTPAQAGYEGRVDLGNTHPGDGSLYRGRGIFENTGRAAYQRLKDKFSFDFVSYPERLADPEWSVLAACDYWSYKKLTQYADADNGLAVGRVINIGHADTQRTPNGWDVQAANITALKRLYGI